MHFTAVFAALDHDRDLILNTEIRNMCAISIRECPTCALDWAASIPVKRSQ